ncbi:SusC/RagA family TonB-linked outer membrane protein [Pedobacter africanus]|uniref:TonB-linked outer membrane protein, SusC/RagA family n=1 Tax=Pedobacter africanus TaxID=151894 RepID=A0A1W2CU92_9SPHI|nr:SusC/RagA family TonB-linked outer membrane protein [Pedobacter africanus]SMC88809.1 TonB-linked outer membrane protein, SusC/RagA family [Pedobacter africanus]
MYQIIEVIGSRKRLYQKICLIMRLTTVIIIACLMQVSAAGLAQKITLNERNTSLDNVLRLIGKQSGFAIYSDGKTFSKSRKVTVVVNNVSVEEALDQAFKGLGYTYQIDGKTIAIKPKEEPNIFERIIDRFQNIDVTGKVVDENGQPIAGATIKVKGTSITTISNEQGSFILKNVDENAVLEISFLGFQTKNVKALKDLGNIRMELAIGKLDEVTVNAGYYKVKERELTGSIAHVTAKEIENQPVTNVLATMQGRMAGVSVTQNTGMPGSGFRIEIRGQNSLRNDGNRPFYVIDGVPYSSQSIGNSNTSSNMPEQNSPLNSINPADISSIEVLKDADATAIYGSRGANGVVLITTRKGKVGKTSLSTNYASGFGGVTRFKDVMETREYLAMRREAFANDGVTQLPSTAYDVNGTWDQNRNTNWQRELIGGTATYNNLQSSLSGGSALTQFLVNGNYSRETTVFPGKFEYVKGGMLLNINHVSENKRFRLSLSASYTLQSNNLPAVDLTTVATTLAPNAPSLYDKFGNLNWENNTFNNPVAGLGQKIKGNTSDLITSALLSYDLGSGFVVKSNLGYTDLNQRQSNLQPSTIFNPAWGLGTESATAFINNLKRNSWIAEPQLTWNRKIAELAITALLGTTFQQQKGNQLVNYYRGFANNSLLDNPASATTNTVLSSEENLYKYQAFFTRINLNWGGRYLLNLTGRRDGSSRFGPGKKFGNFGAIGAAWIFSEEDWTKEKIPFLTFGKIRASYGISGNDQIGDYQYLDTYGVSGNKYQGIAGVQPNRLFNPDFGWESNRKLEIALETGFFNDRVSTTIAWYNNISDNQLVGIPLPAITGFSSIQSNLDAVVQNRGLEVSISTENIKRKEFRWTTSFNFTSGKNKLISFPGLEGSTYKNQFVIGQPLNISKVYHYTGVDPLTGIYQFKDVNNDGILSAVDDAKTIINRNPKFYGGLGNNFHYRGFELDFLFQFVKQLNLNENFSNPTPGTMNNQPIAVISRWQKPNDIGPYQGYSNSNGTRITANTRLIGSDASYSDASYIRLKNIALSYQLPISLTRNFTCKVSLQGQNVLTFTKYKGIDPEFRVGGYLPPLRIYTGSIQLIF